MQTFILQFFIQFSSLQAKLYVLIVLMMFINWDCRYDCGANNTTKYTSDFCLKKKAISSSKYSIKFPFHSLHSMELLLLLLNEQMMMNELSESKLIAGNRAAIYTINRKHYTTQINNSSICTLRSREQLHRNVCVQMRYVRIDSDAQNFYCNFRFNMHTFRLAQIKITTNKVMRCQTDCCFHWRANICVCAIASASAAATLQNRLSISIGVTASNCHANALQSFLIHWNFRFAWILFLLILNLKIKTVNFSHLSAFHFSSWYR